MPLLTRPRRSADRDLTPAEALERAREVSGQVAGRAREVSGDVAERAAETAERARVAAGPTVDRAREASRPALAQVSAALGTLLRFVLRVAALLPGIGARVLGTVSSVLGGLADRSAELADLETPSRVNRRHRRRRAGLWFAGGFAAGAATGWAVRELTARDQQQADEQPWRPGAPVDGTTTGTPATNATPGASTAPSEA